VSCVIAPKAKVGVVGRTGSGKSTFVSALWRLVEPAGGLDGMGVGALRIDGVDVRGLSLHELRSRLAIIPQDPVLFNDTLRYHLDPNRLIACRWPLMMSPDDFPHQAPSGPKPTDCMLMATHDEP
jgi:ABC-type multidrug transport system fused ATPase/permease subunit